MRPHPDAPTPARRAAAPGAPAGSRGQVPGQVGSDDRGGPWEGNGGRPEQDCAKSRMVARGSVPPFGGSVVRFLTPRTRQAAQVQGPAVTRCLALQPPPSESRDSDLPRFQGGERKAAPGHGNYPAPPRLKPRTNFASAAASSRLSPLLAGGGHPVAGHARSCLTPPRRPHPWGRGTGGTWVHRAACAPSGSRSGTAAWDCARRPVSKPAWHVQFRPLARTVSGTPYENKH